MGAPCAVASTDNTWWGDRNGRLGMSLTVSSTLCTPTGSGCTLMRLPPLIGERSLCSAMATSGSEPAACCPSAIVLRRVLVPVRHVVMSWRAMPFQMVNVDGHLLCADMKMGLSRVPENSALAQTPNGGCRMMREPSGMQSHNDAAFCHSKPRSDQLEAHFQARKSGSDRGVIIGTTRRGAEGGIPERLFGPIMGDRLLLVRTRKLRIVPKDSFGAVRPSFVRLVTIL